MHICEKAHDYAFPALLQGRKAVQQTAGKLDVERARDLAGKYLEGWAASNAINFEVALQFCLQCCSCLHYEG